jgi:hypothetical protein
LPEHLDFHLDAMEDHSLEAPKALPRDN